MPAVLGRDALDRKGQGGAGCRAMWTAPPAVIAPAALSRLPDALRRRALPGAAALVAPCFDAAGNLFCTDPGQGRVFRVSGAQWEVAAEYEGEPRGIAARGQELLLADHRHGLLTLDGRSGAMGALLERAAGEGFRGLAGVLVHRDGSVLFTDAGATGLPDPTGRVWRLRADGRLDRLVSNAPGPSALAADRAGTRLYMAMAGSCEVWCLALPPDAAAGGAGLFFRAPAGGAGPSGLATDTHDRLFVCHPGHGQVWMTDPQGLLTHRVDCTGFGRMPTGCALAPDGRTLLIAEASSGTLLAADIPPP
ncbi:MAG TPA: SMP-30/gluconolactonase/LRE family protein [Acetobacteraceae bacterium]|jgi:gluconolactonase|nr:SMP-30/gluconolactonase/LRE family protein [Acetobacteraceae bacterium]